MSIQNKILLRELKIEDVDFMLMMENDPSIWHVSQTEEPYLRADIESFIRNVKSDLIEDLQLRYVVELMSNGQQIGSVDLFNYDADCNNAGVGITILKDYRGNSYGKYALMQLIEMAKVKHKLDELYCNIFTDNKASIRLFESVGFKREKLLKENTLFQGVKYDEYYYRLKLN